MVTITVTREGKLFPTYNIRIESKIGYMAFRGQSPRKAQTLLGETLRDLICNGTPFKVVDNGANLNITA